LRKVETVVLKRARLFHYHLKTSDPAEFLESLLNLLEKENLRLEDFDVKELPDHQHEVRLSVVTSLDGNRILLRQLRHLGASIRTSINE
jgi:hypothetical protein